MKKILKRLLPGFLVIWVKEVTSTKFSKFRNLDAKSVFSGIYHSNYWRSSESVSGLGSEIGQTGTVITGLENVLSEMKIKSILDIPCGDFNWMQKVDLSLIDYTGADIVEELVTQNKERFKEKISLKFQVLNIITDPLPKCDLIIVRDCFVHFSYRDISASIKNIKSSGCKYILTSTFTDYHHNYNISTGDWRRLNFREKPFNFPEPILLINEHCTEGDGEYRDKSMGLWEVNSI